MNPTVIGEAGGFEAEAFKKECIRNRTYIVHLDQFHISIVDEQHRHITIETNFKAIGTIPSTVESDGTTFLGSEEQKRNVFQTIRMHALV